ncbi:uncharacterized protein LTR77_010038 [Saxophila tyrrhenica]|uniref:N-acetylgalactosaminide beta-1,3-galactosyltransferase n=1 Tax=Saxophila tyrrhenica TaxID=1690608 RepID=A0AAV9NZH6_9PEZI|nr:hypothetical protein LTR77_010038 [Saxophila tyrrhenica]
MTYTPRRRTLNQRSFIIIICILLVLLWQTWNKRACEKDSEELVEKYTSSDAAPALAPKADDVLPCRKIPGAEDTVVIIKTGSTEFVDKLPRHLNTTTRCYPNYLIFSDYEENYEGQQIIDALQEVSPKIKEEHVDFELHRRLKERGRAALAAEELNRVPGDPSAWTGHTDNPGWKLDKWKFLPMVNRTLVEYPDKKWYVFVEADTYVLWGSLLHWLRSMNSNEPHYHGNQMAIAGDLFAHGGSGFVVSHKGLRMVVDHWYEYHDSIEQFTDMHWAGDCVLGKAFRESGVPLTFSYPVLQTDHPGMIPYTGSDGKPIGDVTKRPWCYPTISYHHLNAEWVEDMWQFEQGWLEDKDIKNPGFLRHSDMFKQYIIPRMRTPKMDWDNASDQNEVEIETFEDCRTKCHSDGSCLQYSYRPESKICKMSYSPKLGMEGEGVRSGWILERMWSLAENMPACKDEGFL